MKDSLTVKLSSNFETSKGKHAQPRQNFFYRKNSIIANF